MTHLIVIIAAGLMIFLVTDFAMLLYDHTTVHRLTIVAGIIGGPVFNFWVLPWIREQQRRWR